VNPLDVECIHPFCDAQKGQPCVEFDIEDPKHPTPFLIAGAPGFHGERYASLYMDGSVVLDKEIVERAAEDLI
jgi:hypothetical protein